MTTEMIPGSMNFNAQLAETGQMMGYIPTDPTEQNHMINALSATNHNLSEYVNMEITIKNFVIENIHITDKDTGELRPAWRTVIVDADGTSYGCASTGVFNSIRHIVLFKGTPDQWNEPLTVRVKETNKGTSRILSLEII